MKIKICPRCNNTRKVSQLGFMTSTCLVCINDSASTPVSEPLLVQDLFDESNITMKTHRSRLSKKKVNKNNALATLTTRIMKNTSDK